MRLSLSISIGLALFLGWNASVVALPLTFPQAKLVQMADNSNYVNSNELGELKRNLKLWNKQGILNYRYTLTNNCFCVSEFRGPVIIEVRNGITTSITSAATGQPVNPELFQKYDTVPDLFDLIEDAITNRESDLSVEYNPTLGYPTQINIGNLAADAGIVTTIENLEKI
ncbi:hypothetical protein NUACC21_51760 [Scytonema sp. NUACC21]